MMVICQSWAAAGQSSYVIVNQEIGIKKSGTELRRMVGLQPGNVKTCLEQPTATKSSLPVQVLHGVVVYLKEISFLGLSLKLTS